MSREIKVAVLWPGEIRLYRQTFRNFKATILGSCNGTEKLDVDLFVSTYNDATIPQFTELYRPKAIETDDRLSVYRLSNSILSKIKNNVEYNCWGESNLINIISMFYKLNKCYKLLLKNNINKYDYIIRYRDKIVLNYQINNELLRSINKGSIFIPKFGDWRGGICDVFAIGSPQDMEKYCCNCLENLQTYLEQGCHFHPENIMLWHLVSQNVNLIRKIFTINLLNQTYSDLYDTSIYSVRQGCFE